MVSNPGVEKNTVQNEQRGITNIWNK